MKTKSILTILLSALVCALALGCSSAGGNTMETISPEQAKQIMDSGKPYILVDVRQPAEYAEGHIKGARLIPDNELEQRAPQELPDKQALILVYCRSGRRSLAAAKMLAGMGYTQIKDIGGIISWPYGVEK